MELRRFYLCINCIATIIACCVTHLYCRKCMGFYLSVGMACLHATVAMEQQYFPDLLGFQTPTGLTIAATLWLKYFCNIITIASSFAYSQQTNRLKIADEMAFIKKWITKTMVPCQHRYIIWRIYKRFYLLDFKLADNQIKWLLQQARHVWTNAKKAAELYPDKTYFKDDAKHGFAFLKM